MKLEKKYVGEIWELWNHYHVTQMKLAKDYHVHKSVITYIVNARSKSEAHKRYQEIKRSI